MIARCIGRQGKAGIAGYFLKNSCHSRDISRKKRLVGGISINFCFEFIFSAAWNNFGHKGDNSIDVGFQSFPPMGLNIFWICIWTFLLEYVSFSWRVNVRWEKRFSWKIKKIFWKTISGWERRYFYAKAKEKNFLPAAILSFLMKWAAIKTNISPQSLWETRFLGKTTKQQQK